MLFPQATAERDSDAAGRLQRLAPHMLRVAQLKGQLAGLETRALAAEAVLDGLATAMMVVNATGRVVYMNAVAEQMITAGDGLTVVRFELDAVTPGEGKSLRQLVASALQVPANVTASPGGVMRISRRSGRAPYEALVAPISGTTLGLGFDDPLAAVFLRDPEARIVTPADRLQTPLQSHRLGGAAHASFVGGRHPRHDCRARWGQSGDATVATEGGVPQDRHQKPDRINPAWPAWVGRTQRIARPLQEFFAGITRAGDADVPAIMRFCRSQVLGVAGNPVRKFMGTLFAGRTGRSRSRTATGVRPLREEENRRFPIARQQSALADFGELALRSDNLDEILSEACRLVADALNTDLVKIVEFQKDGKTLKVPRGCGMATRRRGYSSHRGVRRHARRRCPQDAGAGDLP